PADPRGTARTTGSTRPADRVRLPRKLCPSSRLGRRLIPRRALLTTRLRGPARTRRGPPTDDPHELIDELVPLASRGPGHTHPGRRDALERADHHVASTQRPRIRQRQYEQSHLRRHEVHG